MTFFWKNKKFPSDCVVKTALGQLSAKITEIKLYQFSRGREKREKPKESLICGPGSSLAIFQSRCSFFGLSCRNERAAARQLATVTMRILLLDPIESVKYLSLSLFFASLLECFFFQSSCRILFLGRVANKRNVYVEFDYALDGMLFLEKDDCSVEQLFVLYYKLRSLILDDDVASYGIFRRWTRKFRKRILSQSYLEKNLIKWHFNFCSGIRLSSAFSYWIYFKSDSSLLALKNT